MAVACFEDLCAGFCDIARVPVPRLQVDDRGIVAFHVEWRGVTVDVLHCPDRRRDHLFVLVTYGPVPEEAQAARQRLQSLLHANFTSLQPHPCTFSCNPVTHEVVLQHAIPMSDASPTGLLDLVDRSVAQALRWRQGPMPTTAGQPVFVDFA